MQKGKRTKTGVTKKKNICMRMKVRKTKKAKARVVTNVTMRAISGGALGQKKGI